MAVTYFDFPNYLSSIKAIVKDIFQYDGMGASATAFGYHRLMSPPPHGFYWDLYGGGGNVGTQQHAPSLTTNGNNGDWESAKNELVEYQREQMRASLDPDFYQSTEAPEEGLIPGFDFMHMGQLGEVHNDDWGSNMALFNIVYSRYCCLFNLGVTLNTDATDYFTIPSTQSAFYVMWVNWAFHET